LFEKNYFISVFPNLSLNNPAISKQKIPEVALYFKDCWFQNGKEIDF
jgi:hypothetical protein